MLHGLWELLEEVRDALEPCGLLGMGDAQVDGNVMDEFGGTPAEDEALLRHLLAVGL
jgi:hypothetical protein